MEFEIARKNLVEDSHHLYEKSAFIAIKKSCQV